MTHTGESPLNLTVKVVVGHYPVVIFETKQKLAIKDTNLITSVD